MPHPCDPLLLSPAYLDALYADFCADPDAVDPEWAELFQSLPVLQGFFEGDPAAHGFHALLRGLAVYLEKVLDHVDQQKPFVWHNLGFNPELTYALGGACPVTIESLGVLHNLLGDINRSLDFIDSAQSAGIPPDCCSADKIAIGAIQKGLYPPPACTVGVNTPSAVSARAPR